MIRSLKAKTNTEIKLSLMLSQVSNRQKSRNQGHSEKKLKLRDGKYKQVLKCKEWFQYP